ncbi:MAG: hypothetical protein FJ088_10770, partial [Deltaproteobacteria bacterium]|nr:hypothetical protein [Deltaproteobacteria bacterium]
MKMEVKLFKEGETRTLWLVSGTVPVNDEAGCLTVDFIKWKENLHPAACFLPARVKNGEKILWNFKDEKDGFQGVVKLAYLNEGTKETGKKRFFLAYVNEKLEKLVPLDDLNKEVIQAGDSVLRLGGLTPEELLERKMRLAEILCLEPHLEEWERAALTEMREVAAQARAEEEARRAAEREARQRRNREVYAEMKGRDTITAFQPDGRKRWGIPISEEEVQEKWMVLDDGTAVVVVASLDDPKAAPPVCSFFIGKSRGGKCERKGLLEDLSWEDPTRKPAIQADRGVIRLKVSGRVLTLPYLKKGQAGEVLKHNG